jgi:hypothetical protein
VIALFLRVRSRAVEVKKKKEKVSERKLVSHVNCRGEIKRDSVTLNCMSVDCQQKRIESYLFRATGFGCSRFAERCLT